MKCKIGFNFVSTLLSPTPCREEDIAGIQVTTLFQIREQVEFLYLRGLPVIQMSKHISLPHIVPF